MIKTAQPNIPRFEFDTDGNCLGFLIEESRTNTLTRSEDWTVGWTDADVTDTANAATAPDGTTTATKIVADNTNAEHYTSFPSLTSSINTYYTYSVFCKSAELSSVAINVSASRLYATFNLATGTIITSNSNGTDFDNHSATITSYPNGWFRLTLTGQSLRNTSSEYVRVALSNSSTNTLNSGGTWQGDGTSGLYFWGTQYEQGAFPTSYIPTSGSTVTRSADNASISGSNFTEWYRQDEGSIYCSFKNTTTDATTRKNVYSISGSSQIEIRSPNIDFNRLRFVFNGNFNSNPTQFSATLSQRKTAFSYNQIENIGYIDGVYVEPSSHTNDNTKNILYIGKRTVATDYFCGHIAQLTYYPNRLTNSQLQNLTS